MVPADWGVPTLTLCCQRLVIRAVLSSTMLASPYHHDAPGLAIVQILVREVATVYRATAVLPCKGLSTH
eukprot:scaffold226669_cov37-Tisochrysis_lutea.AAC.2